MQPGQAIGPYTLVRELGRGGMGAVWEARHPNVPRPLALKAMIAVSTDPESLARFKREAEVLARVRHPNVLAVHQLGWGAQGPFLVTELVEGTPLSRVVAQGVCAPERAARILADRTGLDLAEARERLARNSGSLAAALRSQPDS